MVNIKGVTTNTDGDTLPKFESRKYRINTWDLIESKHHSLNKPTKQLKNN